ncbi:hypothetical protein MTO96_012665 [Rhipicephalus appendiculatus]
MQARSNKAHSRSGSEAPISLSIGQRDNPELLTGILVAPAPGADFVDTGFTEPRAPAFALCTAPWRPPVEVRTNRRRSPKIATNTIHAHKGDIDSTALLADVEEDSKHESNAPLDK